MSNRTEGITLSLDVRNQNLVADLRENLDYVAASVKQLDAAYDAGTMAVDEYLNAKQRLTRAADTLNRELAAVDAATRRAADAGADETAELNRLVNATLEADAAMERYAAEAAAAASAARELADAEEMAAAAAYHEAEMHRMESVAAREAAAADRDALAAVAAAMAADAAFAAANERVNATLDREAAEAEEAAAALRREMNALYAADGANEEFINSTERAATATAKAGRAAGDSTGRQLLLNQGIQAMSYAFQDATTAGGDFWQKMGSITNNMPQILGMFGLQVKAVAAISSAFVAAIAAGKNWNFIMNQFRETNPFPDMAENVDAMRRELSNAKEEMEKLEKAGSGTADQIARYNTLRARTAELEKRIADEQDRQAALKRVLESRTEEDAARGKAFESATAGRGGEYLDKITQALRADAESQIAAEEGRMNRRIAAFQATEDDPDKRNAFLLEQSKAFREFAAGMRKNDFGRQAEDLMVRLDKGEATAHRILDRLATGANGVNFDGLSARMDEANPLKKAERKAAEDAKKDKDDAAAKEFKAKLGDELDILKGVGGVEKIADELTAAAKDKGLTGDKAVESVKATIADTIAGALGAKGFTIPDAQKGTAAGVIGDLAADAAGSARKRAEVAAGRGEKAADKAADTAAAKATRAEVKGLEDESARTFKAINDEAKRITDIFGRSLGDEYQARVATNAGVAAAGGPVARNAREERALAATGRPFALPPEELERRLIGQMAATFRRGGATEQGANVAALGIADKGNTSLQQELAGAQGNNQQRLIQVAGEHNQFFAQMIGIQGRQGQQIDRLEDGMARLRAGVRDIGRKSQTGQRPATKIR